MSTSTSFAGAVVAWYENNGREFYWRDRDLSPFEYPLTELLLKRTRAETVNAHGEQVLESLPSPEDVVKTDHESLVELIKPFGIYNRRSKNIKHACLTLMGEFDGEIPRTREELLAVSGVGQYAADAILCFAYGDPVLVLDTNTMAVAEQYFGIEPPDDPRQDTQIRPVLEPLVPKDAPRAFNWGIIDIGAVLRTGDVPDLPVHSQG